jgi:glycosyltransferase involved in cell wall biosynthesis
MHRGYNSERPERESPVLELAKRARKSGPSRTGISMHPDVTSAPAACAATIPGGADDSRNTCASARFRVLKVTQSYYPFLERGGSAVTVHALAQGLARRGYPVTVLTSDLGIKKMARPAGAIVRTSEGWRCDEEGVETLYFSARGSYRSLTWNPGIFAFCGKRLKSFDIVHIYGTYDLLGPVVARACRQRGIPYLLEPMGMFRPIIRNLALKWLYRRLLGESAVRGAVRLVATSLQEQRELIEEGIAPERITIRRNGIELPKLPGCPGAFRRQWKIPPDALLVLFLGRIVSKKSPELLLEAFARWRRSSGATQHSVLVFAGPAEEANYRQKLEAEIKRLGLGGAVRFTGALYGDVKWSALVDADIFVLPSQNENFGNAAAEAVACGAPVVVTDRCGIAPLIEGRAGLVIPHQCEALVRALHQLSDAGLRQRMKLGCMDVARGLGWEQPLTETEALYAQLLSDPSAARREPQRTFR